MRVRPWLASLAVIAVVGLTVPAAAQDEHVSGRPSIGLPLPPIGLPLPSIGLPLPSIGLPLPTIGLSGTETVRPGRAAPPLRSSGRAHRGTPLSGVPIYTAFYPVFYPVLYPVEAGPVITSSTPGLPGSPAPGQPIAPTFEPTVGSLRLRVEPTAGQQIFVDGSYVGTPDDLDGDLALDAGLHVVDVQAPGFESARIPVRIVAGRTITYRGTLQSAAHWNDTARSADTEHSNGASWVVQPAPSVANPTTPAPIGYYIPGCYLGNVPPEDVKLPEGCDPHHAVIVRSSR